jgi:phosphopantothenoylcysteine synthetase/decarboxylase
MKALTSIQAALVAPKDQFNSFGKYKYRSTESILAALKPLLIENDAQLTMTDDIVEVGGRVYVKATASIVAGEETVTVSAFARESLDKKGMDDAQITGSASSYARKYALNGLFCIDDTKDSDATNDHGKAPTAKPQTIVGKPANPTPKPTTIKVMESMTEATTKEQLEKLWARANQFAWTEEEMNTIRSCYTNTLARL